MTDPRFFKSKGPFTLGELAAMSGTELAGGAAPDHAISDLGALDTAGPGEHTFLENRRYPADFRVCRAGPCLVAPDFVAPAPAGLALLVTPRPRRNIARRAPPIYPPATAAPGV